MATYRYAGHVYRYRRYGRSRVHPAAAGVAVAVGLALAVAHPHHGHASAASLTAARIPAGGSYTPQSWAATFLSVLGMPRTPCNLGAIDAWEAAEGGNWANAAAANPLNTTMPAPGSWAVNSVGVRAYPTWREGLAATIQTITNGRYGTILSALHAGNDAQAVADAVTASPWGTGTFGASC
jgi:hypothetical protein